MKRLTTFLFLILFSASSMADNYTLLTILENRSDKKEENVGNFFVDITQEIFKRLNMGLKVKQEYWIKAQDKVKKAKWNDHLLITPLTRTVEREDKYDWILPVETYRLSFVTNDSYVDVNDIASFKDSPVCVLRESAAQYKAKELGLTNIKPQIAEKKCFQLLARGTVKIVLVHGMLSATKHMAKYGSADDLIKGKTFEETTLYLASTKGAVSADDKARMEKAFTEIKEDGTFNMFRDRY